MLHYSRFTVEQFTEDEQFRNWVLAPTDELNAYWESVMLSLPERKEDILSARAIISVMSQKYPEKLSEREIEERVDVMTSLINRQTKQLQSRSRWMPFMRNAAAAVLIIGVVAYLFKSNESAVREQLAHWFPAQQWEITKTNHTDHVLTLFLPDSSVVNLEPGGTLVFPSKFDENQRKVVLEGNAFFEVTAHPSKPFLVYIDHTITKVLGTSFRITTLPDQTVKVVVSTGKVMVFRQHPNHSPESTVQKSVLLLPEQEVSVAPVSPVNGSPVGAVKQSKDPAEQVETQRQMVYEDTPVAVVLKELEEAFRVRINYNKSAFDNCLITSTFSDETLVERINLICTAVGLSYLPENGAITIKGKGCEESLNP